MTKDNHNAQEPSGSFARVQNESRITPMRRIFKPSPTPPWRGFSLITDCLLETQVASARPFIPQGGQEGGLIREKNKSVASALSVIPLNAAREPKAKELIYKVLSYWDQRPKDPLLSPCKGEAGYLLSLRLSAWYCLPDSSYCAPSPSAPSPCSKSITDNADATDF